MAAHKGFRSSRKADTKLRKASFVDVRLLQHLVPMLKKFSAVCGTPARAFRGGPTGKERAAPLCCVEVSTAAESGRIAA